MTPRPKELIFYAAIKNGMDAVDPLEISMVSLELL